MKRGIFITFEGGEGSGKTTQIKKVSRWFEKHHFKTVVTREPGGTPFADWIREILLDHRNTGIDPTIELLLYEVARRDHLNLRILPALKKGQIVLCDRFTDATTAYQGYARRLPLEIVQALNRYAVRSLKPDRTFLFDLPIDSGLRRVRRRRTAMNRLDRESRMFHERVRRGYLKIAASEKKRFRIIDARKNPNEVFRLILQDLEKIL